MALAKRGAEFSLAKVHVAKITGLRANDRRPNTDVAIDHGPIGGAEPPLSWDEGNYGPIGRALAGECAGGGGG